MTDLPLSSNHSGGESYDPQRSSVHLQPVFPLEKLAQFEPYLRAIAAGEWRRSLAFKDSVSDLVQESLAAGVRDFKAFDGKTEGELAAWLRRILFRVMHSKLRKYKTKKADIGRETVRDAQDISSGEPSPSEIYDLIEQRLRLEIALQQIASHYRQVIELHHIEGLTFVDIGVQLGKTSEAVRKMWVRGLVALQKHFRDLPRANKL